MFCATRVQLTCLSMERIFELCRRCWVMQPSQLLRFTPRFQQTVCGLSTVMRIRELQDEYKASNKEGIEFTVAGSADSPRRGDGR